MEILIRNMKLSYFEILILAKSSWVIFNKEATFVYLKYSFLILIFKKYMKYIKVSCHRVIWNPALKLFSYYTLSEPALRLTSDSLYTTLPASCPLEFF